MCPGRSAPRSGALQNRDRYELRRNGPRLSSAPLRKSFALHRSRGTLKGRLAPRVPVVWISLRRQTRHDR
jgi:hypothetical protein